MGLPVAWQWIVDSAPPPPIIPAPFVAGLWCRLERPDRWTSRESPAD